MYDADTAWVEELSTGDVRLFFAKRDRNDSGQLRSRLEIRYPVENLVGHLWRLDVAEQHSDSLRRCLYRVRKLTAFV